MSPTSEAPSREMPKYRCHKVVHALKIAELRPLDPLRFKNAVCKGSYALGSACGNCERCDWERAHGPSRLGIILVPADSEFAAFPISAEYVQKHNPREGGYFVVYEDGYQSFSPAEAFESGYTRI